MAGVSADHEQPAWNCKLARKQPDWRSGFALRASSLSLLLLLNMLVLGACRRSSKPGANRAAKSEPRRGVSDRRAVTLRLKGAMEQAGGSEVWVKEAALPPRPADAPLVDVLAPARTFRPVLSALEKDAQAQGLEARREPPGQLNSSAVVVIRVLKGRELVGLWRLREVPQLMRVAIVIDDLGQNLEAARQLLELPYPLTFSVLPRLAHSQETAEEAHHAGREVMVHLPMEPEPGSRVAAGEGAIQVGMPSRQVLQIVDADVAAVPYARGANNHMGSRATADRALMMAVMKALADRRMYFVDSRTTAHTVAFDMARSVGIPAFYRSVFLDDTETTDSTLGQLRELCGVVRRQGAALAIGHPYPTTLAALKRFLPELEREDIELVPASQLVRAVEVARLSPPRQRP
jgi:polysaccharide deacetylase 2 family uncharacterized protein YibQ